MINIHLKRIKRSISRLNADGFCDSVQSTHSSAFAFLHLWFLGCFECKQRLLETEKKGSIHKQINKQRNTRTFNNQNLATACIRTVFVTSMTFGATCLASSRGK